MHSVVCLMTGPYPLPKLVLHKLRSIASSCNEQYLIFSLKSFSSCLHLLPLLPVTYVHPSIFPSITCSRRQFLPKMWPIQIAFLLFIFVGYSCPPPLFLTLLHVSLDRPNWSSSPFSNNTFQNFSGISGILSEVFGFHHLTRLYSKCSILLNSSLNLNPIFFSENCLLVECCYCHGNLEFNFPCIPFFICYRATQVVEIFLILGLFFIYHNCIRDDCLAILITLTFFIFLSIL